MWNVNIHPNVVYLVEEECFSIFTRWLAHLIFYNFFMNKTCYIAPLLYYITCHTIYISHNHFFIISTMFKMVWEKKNDPCTFRKFQNWKLGIKKVPFPPKTEQQSEQNNSYCTSVLQLFLLCSMEKGSKLSVILQVSGNKRKTPLTNSWYRITKQCNHSAKFKRLWLWKNIGFNSRPVNYSILYVLALRGEDAKRKKTIKYAIVLFRSDVECFVWL